MAWTAPRTWVAAETVTAALLNTHVRDDLLALVDRHQVIRKAADESVTSSTVLQADNELVFTAVAGQSYAFDVVLIATCASSAVDISVAFSFPTGTLAFGVIGLLDTVGAGNTGDGQFGATASATSGTTAFSLGVSSSATTVRISGSFLCTTGGTVSLMWAQVASSASSMTVKAGSTLTAVRVAV